MNESAVLKVKTRPGNNKPERKRLRNEGYLLGNIYGKNMEPLAIAVNSSEFRQTLNKFGRNSVFTIETSDNQTITTMVKDIQVGQYGLEYKHIDLQEVSLTEEIVADVAIRIEGMESLEAKRLIVNRQIDIVQVAGFPQNIPDSIEINVTEMGDGEMVTVADLILPEGIKVNLEDDLLILSVNEPRAEEETDAEDGEEASVEAEVIGEKNSSNE